MKVLVSGASGFIGLNVSKYLMDHGHEVVGLTRNPNEFGKRHPEFTKLITWNDLNTVKWLDAGFDAIINLAGYNIGKWPWTRRRKRYILESRIRATQMLSRFCHASSHAPKVFVQASAIGYYGYNVPQPTDESSPKGDGLLANVAEAWEQALELPDTTRVVITRLGVVIGDGGTLKKLSMTSPLGFIVYPASRQQWFAHVRMDTLLRFIGMAINGQEIKGVYNLVEPDHGTLHQVIEPLGKLLIPIPSFFFRLVLGQMANETILANQRILPKALLDIGFPFRANG